jgi:hypothetical protein
MTKLEDIEKAVTELTPEQLAQFRDWFEALDAARFDEKVARDAQSGRLDALAERARDAYRKGRAREL